MSGFLSIISFNTQIQPFLPFENKKQEIEQQISRATLDLDSDNSLQKFLDDSHPFENKEYIPQDLAKIDTNLIFNSTSNFQLRKEAKDAFEEMSKAFSKTFKGKKFSITSAYRSYAFQKKLQKNCHKHQCAEAGSSEHQAGLAVDLGVNGRSLNQTTNKRLEENAHKRGFHQTYQKGVETDGKMIEPRHWRYIGREFATLLYNNKQSFREWFYATEEVRQACQQEQEKNLNIPGRHPSFRWNQKNSCY